MPTRNKSIKSNLDRPLNARKASRSKRAEKYFFTDDLKEGLTKRTARGGVYTITAAGLNTVITIICSILITRQLTKEDFGLFGMVSVATGFAAMFVDLGLSKAVIQHPEINHDQVSTLFWINLALASGIAALVAGLAPALVWFYDEPRLLSIVLVMCIMFIISASSLQQRALMQRRMEFGTLNVIDVAAPLLGSLVSLALAYLGAGYWALVALPITIQLARSCSLWVVCPWMPGLPTRGSGVRKMATFGGNITGFQFINYFARNADNAMLGFAWGAGPLGLYTRAYTLMMLPATKMNAPLSSVVVPALCRARDQPELYRKIYFRVLFCSASSLTLAIAWLTMTIDQLVPLLLGPKWLEIIPIFLALSVSCAMAATNSANGWLYLSIGHVDRQLKWTYTVYVPVLLISMAIGLQWGVLGMAVGVSTGYLLLKPISFAYASRGTPVDVRTFLIIVFQPILIGGIAAVTSWWLAGLWEPPTTPWSRIGQIAARTAFFVIVLLFLSLISGFGSQCIKNIKYLKNIFTHQNHKQNDKTKSDKAGPI